MGISVALTRCMLQPLEQTPKYKNGKVKLYTEDTYLNPKWAQKKEGRKRRAKTHKPKHRRNYINHEMNSVPQTRARLSKKQDPFREEYLRVR